MKAGESEITHPSVQTEGLKDLMGLQHLERSLSRREGFIECTRRLRGEPVP